MPDKPSPTRPSAKSPPAKPSPSARRLANAREGAPVPDNNSELPPVIRHAEVMTIALVGLLIICVIAGLYLAKAFFLPITMAFIVGTMLSPAASFLERYRIPRAVAAVLIVAAASAGVAFMVGLVASPAVEWSAKLPELGGLLKEKLHVFDRPLALWQELQSMLGGPDTLTTFHLPKIEWVQPTLEFLSPTFAEFLLFIATLILFIASWRDLRRALVMNFGKRAWRLRTLRILNEIEEHLGNYILMLTTINVGVGIATGLICALTGMPNPASLGALAAILNFIPIIGPVAMFAVLVVVGLVALPTIGAGLLASAMFAVMTFLEGHFLTPMIVGRRLALNALAVFMALAFWTWLWGPMGAFLSSPLLIVALIVKEHLMPPDSPQLPQD
ncbi:AI-2E family transporter [Bradyrhizobium sp. AZCC 1620]|uniref:AI-2E family transporter n=1 Tax=unclassified Bradyrhizobium TaxID=2631580 RepID=UPI003FA5FA32